MEVIFNLMGTVPPGYEALGYIMQSVTVLVIILEILNLFKHIVTESMRIGR